MIRNFKGLAALLVMGLVTVATYAQDKTQMAYFNEPGKVSLNKFEETKTDTAYFDNVKVRVGGDFALQFQGLEQSTDADIQLLDISKGFNLATANLNIDVQLADGVRMNLITYLSARHHNEAWVKGGYIQFDKLAFLNSEVIDKIMKNVTIKVGHMENNYGDAHFRRTDNGRAILNPFVGNLVMDAFIIEAGGEVYYKGDNGLLAMVGVTSGQNDPAVTVQKTDPSLYFKLGFDKQLTEDFRARLTGSYYGTNRTARNTLYSGDRGGSRYYYVLLPEGADTGESNFTTGRLNPGFTAEIHAFMINPFIKYKGLEFFGTAEFSNGRSAAEFDNRNASQFAGELIYRFGDNEKFYVGAKYNTVTAELNGYDNDITVNRAQASAGWFLTNNILAKVEYVNQQYKDYPTDNIFNGANFKGFMVEAVLSF